MREPCDAAKHGFLCEDEIRRKDPKNTLCGFDQSFWNEITKEDEGEDCYDCDEYE